MFLLLSHYDRSLLQCNLMQLCFQSFARIFTGSGWFVRGEIFHETGPRHCRKSSEVATDPELGFSTSGNAARHHVRPLETQPSEGFIDLNESDNKLWMLRVNKFFQVHVMRRRAKVKCFEQGQMTRCVKHSQVKS